jgi:hypothetical protein
MIRHQQKQMGPPKKLLLPMPDGVEQLPGNGRQSKLIVKSLAAIDGDKIYFPAWIYPKWNVMRQMFWREPFTTTEIKSSQRIGNEDLSQHPLHTRVGLLALRGVSPLNQDIGRRACREMDSRGLPLRHLCFKLRVRQ